MTNEDLQLLLAKPGYGLAGETARKLNPQALGTTEGIRQMISDTVANLGKKRKSKEVDPESESRIQQRLIQWWALECVNRKLPEKLLMAFPLQGRRSAANGARMKAEGMRAGTPDMFLAVASQYDRETGATYHGLWIELKKPKGKLADSQKEMLQILDVQGYAAYAAYGFDPAVKLITNYLNGEQFF